MNSLLHDLLVPPQPSAMPDKQLTIATYAAGASLAAITLVYVFGPTFFIDGETASSSASSRKRGIVGLSNPANDCFINSVLQALAGLSDLRNYVIRETHRRKLGGPKVYAHLVEDPMRKGMPQWKIEGLQAGMVTQGLKDILDALNEKPIYKKTISAAGFIQVLEAAFKQRISRQQQDAQEFLQVVAERLCDEYHAGRRARNQYSRLLESELDPTLGPDKKLLDERLNGLGLESQATTISNSESNASHTSYSSLQTTNEGSSHALEKEEGFPLEGCSESQIECLTCGFKPAPTTSTFCSLTLSVPQVNSTTLSSCFDQMFKTEHIDDYKCEKCRLLHALELFQQELSRSNSKKFKEKTQISIEKLQHAIETNPEEEILDVELPDSRFAPKRRIAKHARITEFPKVMAIHLSRSIFDAGKSTMKNSAKVSFPERLPLGGLVHQKFYRLSSVVCHKGNHHSGHYESFRRQTNGIVPFATTNTFQPAEVYSKPPTPNPSQIPTPRNEPADNNTETHTLSSTPEMLSPISAASSSPSLANINGTDESGELSPPPSAPAAVPGRKAREADPETSSIRSIARSAKSKLSKSSKLRSSTSSPSTSPTVPTVQVDGPDSTVKSHSRTSIGDAVRGKKRGRKNNNLWWRISDEKVKECKTGDVLGMQKEVYLLFYELEKDESRL